jgi:hypothetical protein
MKANWIRMPDEILQAGQNDRLYNHDTRNFPSHWTREQKQDVVNFQSKFIQENGPAE